MIESSQGGAEAVFFEFQLYRILYFSELRGVPEPHAEHATGGVVQCVLNELEITVSLLIYSSLLWYCILP